MRDVLLADLSRFPRPGRPFQEASPSRRALLKACLDEQGAWAVIELRVRQWARGRSRALRLCSAVTRKLVEVTTGIQIAADAQIGRGLYIGHFGGIVIGDQVVAGENLSIHQGVTIGAGHGGSPRLGDGVYIAPGAKLFGAIVVGDDVWIGANAVVNRDLPSGCTAVGVPARVVPRGARATARATTLR